MDEEILELAKAYDKYFWFAKSKSKVSSFVLSLLRFQGLEVQSEALNCRQKLGTVNMTNSNFKGLNFYINIFNSDNIGIFAKHKTMLLCILWHFDFKIFLNFNLLYYPWNVSMINVPIYLILL